MKNAVSYMWDVTVCKKEGCTEKILGTLSKYTRSRGGGGQEEDLHSNRI